TARCGTPRHRTGLFANGGAIDPQRQVARDAPSRRPTPRRLDAPRVLRILVASAGRPVAGAEGPRKRWVLAGVHPLFVKLMPVRILGRRIRPLPQGDSSDDAVVGTSSHRSPKAPGSGAGRDC